MAERCGLFLLLVINLLAGSCCTCPKDPKKSIRLADGPNETEGRLEVCENGKWGTVCSYGFRYSEARTVCWQLGFRDAMYSKCCLGKYGPGTGDIIEGLSCEYEDKNVAQCDRKELTFDCKHSHDVGVRCIDSRPPECNLNEIRLVGGPNEYEGRVEVCDYNEHWGTVCNFIFDETEAEVVCRQLGFPTSGAQAVHNARELYGKSTRSIFLDDPDCRGTESSILFCNTYMSSFPCTFETYAGVKCQAPGTKKTTIASKAGRSRRPSFKKDLHVKAGRSRRPSFKKDLHVKAGRSRSPFKLEQGPIF